MRVRLHNKSKPDNYTESYVINVADRWREGNVWYLVSGGTMKQRLGTMR